MALQGSISDFGLSDIFQLIFHQKKTGVLYVKTKTEEFNIFFENGMVVLGEPTNQDPLNRIGEKLLRSGKITEDQLKEALSEQGKTKEKVGQILLKKGMIAKKDLLKGLGFQVKETLYGLFRLKEGDYSFKPMGISYDKNFWEPINTEFILMEGVRRVDEWPMIEKVIPSFDLIFGKIEENANKIQGVKKEEEEELDDIFDEGPSEEGLFLTKGEMAVYESVNGNRSVRQIIDSLGSGEFETCKAFSNLLTAGLIQALKIPQAIPSDAKPIPLKIRKVRKPVLTIRNVGTFCLFLAIVTLGLLGSGNFSGFTQRSLGVFQPYKNLILHSQFNQLSFSVQVFWESYGRLPETLNEMVDKLAIEPELISDPWGDPIIYTKGDGAGGFSFKSKMGLN